MLFRPIVEYYMIDIHTLMAMCIKNPVYNSQYVRYTVFFYNYKFREQDDVGTCCNICLGVDCNTYIGEDIVYFWGESCKL